MNIGTLSGKIETAKTEALVLMHFEGEPSLPRSWAEADHALHGLLRKVISGEEFSGKTGQVLLLHSTGNLPAARILLAGLGKRREASLDRIRQAMGPAARYLRQHGVKSFTIAVDRAASPKKNPHDIAQAIVEGCLLGLYEFLPYRTEKPEERKSIERITLIAPAGGMEKQVSEGARKGRILADAVNFSRDLVNHPSNAVTPTRLAREAAALAKKHGFTCKVLERADAQRLGMGAFLGVARGSHEPPKFIVMEYRRGGSSPVVLVGKSITFDSGGISIKPAERMEEMKGDMAGGAAVLGTFKAVAELGLPVSLVGILPATENMPGGSAIKPGDVVKGMSGLTVEVINTDAEGRLVLADGLTYAARYKPSAVIDLATLTGACVVALGHHATGVLGNDQRLIERMIHAGEQTGEKLWQLPLWDEYYEQIKSDVADIKNVGGRGAGTITAAAFLGKFTKDVTWAHLDIAGTAWVDAAKPYVPKGATGVGVRLLTQYLSSLRPAKSAVKKRAMKSRKKPGP